MTRDVGIAVVDLAAGGGAFVDVDEADLHIVTRPCLFECGTNSSGAAATATTSVSLPELMTDGRTTAASAPRTARH